MSKNALWVVILLLVVGVGYMWSKGQSKMVGEGAVKVETKQEKVMSPTPTVEPKTIKLDQLAASGQSGTAVFEPQGDKTKVTLSMVGKTYASPQPAHVHIGQCPKPGDVKYALNNVVAGKSETVIAVKFDDLFTTLLPLAVNVHESAEKASVYTACGDLY